MLQILGGALSQSDSIFYLYLIIPEKQKVLAATAAAKQLGKKQKKPSFTLPLNELPSTDDDNTTLATKHVSENETPKLAARRDSSSKKASKRQLDHSTVPKNKRPRLQEETPHVHQVGHSFPITVFNLIYTV